MWRVAMWFAWVVWLVLIVAAVGLLYYAIEFQPDGDIRVKVIPAALAGFTGAEVIARPPWRLLRELREEDSA